MIYFGPGVATTETQVRRIVLGAGALLAVYGGVRWWHGERVFARMRPTTCTLVIKAVESKLLVDQGRRRGRGDITGRSARLRYRDEARLVFAHTLDGRKYTFREDFNGDRMPLADYQEGKAPTPAATIRWPPTARRSRRLSTARRWTPSSSWPAS